MLTQVKQESGYSGRSATIGNIEVVRRGTTIGAEIQGVDFNRPLDDVTRDAILSALADWKVVYFRNAHITPEQQKAFGARFGELTVHPSVPHLEGLPEVIVLDYTKPERYPTDVWHSDETFRLEPPLGSFLRCVRPPEVGGDTMWADMYAAYEGLSDKMQHFIDGLEAVHDFTIFRRKFDNLPPKERHAGLAEMEEQLPNATHPVVRTHPVTKRKALFVNAQFTIAIKGMRKTESRALLDLLYAQATIPEYQFRLHWEAGTMAFWDNRPTQHYAVNDYHPHRRTMHRVTVKGDRPF
ncbi:MAG: TauD/TfdA family dioxygenase [Rugosibacter sp.]|nr:TauD/TfdA family dioxygenase [Rugosibacter sp.]